MRNQLNEMTDRLHIEITGDLPDDRRYGILAAAEGEIKDRIKSFNERHKMAVTASVRSVRPGKKTAAAPSVRAVPDAAE